MQGIFDNHDPSFVAIFHAVARIVIVSARLEASIWRANQFGAPICMVLVGGTIRSSLTADPRYVRSISLSLVFSLCTNTGVTQGGRGDEARSGGTKRWGQIRGEVLLVD